MKSLLIAALVVFGASAFAGHEVGNGGGVIVCTTTAKPPAKDKVTVELLDLYEARVLRNLKSALGNPKENFDLKIKRVLNKFSRIAPIRTQKYSELYEKFFNEAVIIPDADLVFIPDAGNLLLPKGCDLKQVAIQKSPEFPGDNRYFISKEFWDLMDNNSKAALVLHEIIYNEAIYLGHQNSKAVRYLNSYLTSERLDSITQEELVHMLFAAKFVAADYLGTMVDIMHYSKDNYISIQSLNYNSPPLAQPSYFSGMKLPHNVQFGPYRLGEKFIIDFVKGQPTAIDGLIEVSLPRLKIRSFSEAPFRLDFLSGGISDFTFVSPNAGEEHFFIQHDDSIIELDAIWIKNPSDYSNILVAGIKFVSDGSLKLDSYTGLIRFKNEKTGYESPRLISEGKGRFDHGIVQSGILVENGRFQTPQGEFSFVALGLNYPYKVYQKFDSAGRVVSGVLAAGQTVAVWNDSVTTDRNMIVHFLENGKAVLEEVPSQVPVPSP